MQTDVLEIQDLRVFEMLDNPVRLRILRHLDQPRTVKQLAEWMEVPPTRLYYHVNLLREAGVIVVVDTRKVGAMIEKVYQATARTLRPGKAIVTGGHAPSELATVAVNAILNGARLDAEAALTGHFADLAATGTSDIDRVGSLVRTIVSLTEEGRENVDAKVRELLDLVENLEAGDQGVEYGLTLVLFPLAGSAP
jgi:DNA-binding transcriptional ArsR family regulator